VRGFVAQIGPRIGITEESGDVDQDPVEDRREFIRVDLQVVEVVGISRDRQLGHPAVDPAHQARSLVAGEVEAACLLQIQQ
jgi:hypothetical protein